MRAAITLLVAIPSLVAAQTSTVTGVVYDSISRSPLAGALVQFSAASDSLAGRLFSAVSDSLGSFVVRDVPYGRYHVGFFHMALDSMGIEARSRETEVRADSVRVDLATPAPRTLVSALCMPNADSSASGLLLGHVRSAATESFLPGAVVSASWTEWRLEAGKLREETRTAHSTTRPTGAFAMCNLPDDVAILIGAAYEADSSGFVDFTVPSGEVRHLSLHVGDGRVNARLSGVVRDSLGRPVPNARVTVWESGRKAVTNTRGAFTLDSLPSGTRTLEVLALGYTPARSIIHLTVERPATADVVLLQRVTELATVRVTATFERQLAQLERRQDQFERHRARGGGYFITPAEIERRPRQTRFGQLLQGIPGVRVNCARGECQVTMTRASTYAMRGIEGCMPSVYIDGHKSAFSAGDLDWMMYAPDILAIEVYSRAVGRPADFIDFDNKCGAVAVWTKPILRAQ